MYTCIVHVSHHMEHGKEPMLLWKVFFFSLWNISDVLYCSGVPSHGTTKRMHATLRRDFFSVCEIFKMWCTCIVQASHHMEQGKERMLLWKVCNFFLSVKRSECGVLVLFRCPITWNKGKNVTVKVVKKKQKHKGRGITRTVTKTVQNDSFFNFFSPPEGRFFTFSVSDPPPPQPTHPQTAVLVWHKLVTHLSCTWKLVCRSVRCCSNFGKLWSDVLQYLEL